jgi:hypothetical protein
MGRRDMKGQHEIISLRMQGKAPAAVFWDDDGDEVLLKIKNEPRPYKSFSSFFELVTKEEEPVSGMDLRFLVRLDVFVSTMEVDRLQKLMGAARKAGAKKVIGTAFRKVRERSETYYVEVQEQGMQTICQRF